MSELRLKIPEQLERKMERFDWIDWPKVAIKSFSERIGDIEEFELGRKIAEISEIPEDDKREVKESLVEEIISSCEKTDKSEKCMTLEELDELMGLG